jgi:hypothetical protein
MRTMLAATPRSFDLVAHIGEIDGAEGVDGRVELVVERDVDAGWAMTATSSLQQR